MMYCMLTTCPTLPRFPTYFGQAVVFHSPTVNDLRELRLQSAYTIRKQFPCCATRLHRLPGGNGSGSEGRSDASGAAGDADGVWCRKVCSRSAILGPMPL